MSEETESTKSSGLDRRAALKKAAVAAGVVAWTTPAVVALTPKVASAAVTGCFPNVAFTFQAVGSACQGYPPTINPGPGNSCCQAGTFFVSGSGGCGGGPCPGNAAVTVTAVAPVALSGGNPPNVCPQLINIANCSGTATATVNYTATCPDGVTYTCTAVYAVQCGTGAATLVSNECT